MPQVIEWKNAGSEDIVWKYPDEEITWGAQLIVHEYEMAVKPVASIDLTYHVQTALQMAVLGWRGGKVVRFDRAAEKLVV